MTRALALWGRLRSTYWFVPAVMTAAAVALAVLLTETTVPLPGAVTRWLIYTGGADGARALLSSVAGSMITVVSVTFSVTVVALTVSSQHFGPRLLNSFMRDTAAQVVLGTFIATFAYCLVVLRTVHGEGDGYDLFVPHLAVTGGVALTLLSVAMLIFYVHHVASSLQVAQIAKRVAQDLEGAIERLYPDPIGNARDAGLPPPVAVEARPLAAPRSGYVQLVDAARLLQYATNVDAVVWVIASPGTFVVEGSPLAMVRATRRLEERALQGAWVLGHDRTTESDAGFAVQQLVEVALHALSPSIHEPFTAITCLDRLGQGFAALAARAIPDPARVDGEGRLRVIAPTHTLAALLHDAFAPLHRAAAAQPIVAVHVLQTLGGIGSRVHRAADREAIRAEIERACSAAVAHAAGTHERDELLAARERALARLPSFE